VLANYSTAAAPEEPANIRYHLLAFQHEGPVATVTLDRPETGNRIDGAMAAELREVCRTIREDEGVRVVIVTGAGSAFSAGRETPPADLAAGSQEELLGWIGRLQVGSCLAELTVPVIAAVNGDAIDHGLELALAADLRIAADGANFGLTDLSRGGFPWDGGTQRLPRLVGPAWARDMILTGRIIGATQALGLGLVNRVVKSEELLAQARQLAESIVAGAPIAARYAKEAVHMGMDLTLSQGLRLEADLNILLHSTSDRAEGLQSFLERRSPGFTGR
jgi:enoyl-CoA hydratase/carnithine racemase